MAEKIIKFLDLRAQYPQIKKEILEKFNDILDNTRFVGSNYVREFEKFFAEYIGVKHCIAVNNGTNALYVSLLCWGIRRGDEVIMPVNTFIATAEAVSLLGAKPVFVDINEKTYNIDVDQIEDKITGKTRAIIPVHLYGQCVDMEPILSLAGKHNLVVIEDACQAHGAEHKGKKAGSMGDVAAFSFYPGKNLGSWGEGGAITTNNDWLAEKVKLIRDHGSKKKYYHKIIGGNFRMSEFQGAVLCTKIQYLESWNEKRRRNAALYHQFLKDNRHIILPQVAKHNKPIWHLFVIRVSERDKVRKYLEDRGIETGIHYPFPLHLTEAYQHLGYKKGDFPTAEKIQQEIISLPMYAELTEEEIKTVTNKITEFYE